VLREETIYPVVKMTIYGLVFVSGIPLFLISGGFS
jgi:hypothetical protein